MAIDWWKVSRCDGGRLIPSFPAPLPVDEQIMDMSTSSLLASLLVSSIGAGLLIYGKRSQRLPQFVCGMVLSICPLCVSGALWILAISGAALLAMWQVLRTGA